MADLEGVALPGAVDRVRTLVGIDARSLRVRERNWSLSRRRREDKVSAGDAERAPFSGESRVLAQL